MSMVQTVEIIEEEAKANLSQTQLKVLYAMKDISSNIEGDRVTIDEIWEHSVMSDSGAKRTIYKAARVMSEEGLLIKPFDHSAIYVLPEADE